MPESKRGKLYFFPQYIYIWELQTTYFRISFYTSANLWHSERMIQVTKSDNSWSWMWTHISPNPNPVFWSPYHISLENQLATGHRSIANSKSILTNKAQGQFSKYLPSHQLSSPVLTPYYCLHKEKFPGYLRKVILKLPHMTHLANKPTKNYSNTK